MRALFIVGSIQGDEVGEVGDVGGARFGGARLCWGGRGKARRGLFLKYVSYPFLVKPAIAHVAHFAPPFGCRVHWPYRFSGAEDEEDDNFLGGLVAKGCVRSPDLVFTMVGSVPRTVVGPLLSLTLPTLK